MTGFSKIFELLIIHRLKQHSIGKIILANEQFGFHDNFTTVSAIFKFIESSFSAWNNKEYITGRFCDLTSSVIHEFLVLKLEFYAVKGSMLNWLKCYLYNRKQRVVLQFVNAPNLLSNWEVS